MALRDSALGSSDLERKPSSPLLVISLQNSLTVFKTCCGAPNCEMNQQCSFSWLPELWIFFYFLIIFFSKFKNDSLVFDFTNMRSLLQRDVLCKNTYAYCLGSRTVSPVVVQMNDLANVFESSTRTWRDWCARRCPSGYGPNRCCPCRCCPSRSYPSNCGGCRARCCPSRSC